MRIGQGDQERMTELDVVAERFEAYRPQLRGVAFRMLGSVAEADDAVQEAWLRVARTDLGGVHNLGGWLTTVVSRYAWTSWAPRVWRETVRPARRTPSRRTEQQAMRRPRRCWWTSLAGRCWWVIGGSRQSGASSC